MKKIILLIAFVSLTGCANIMTLIPSKWDDNQAKSITDIQQDARRFDCKGDLTAQLNKLDLEIEWFDIYATTKPTRDVNKLTETLTTTVKEFQTRTKAGPVSPLYCDLKKKIIQQQADIIAAGVMGRL
jgi:uncharacterized protein YceK